MGGRWPNRNVPDHQENVVLRRNLLEAEIENRRNIDLTEMSRRDCQQSERLGTNYMKKH